MSAWLCSAEHIAEIVRHTGNIMGEEAGARGVNPVTKQPYRYGAKVLAEILARENLRSLMARYPEHYKGCKDFTEYFADCRSKAKGKTRVSTEELVGLLRSYRYQSCEHEEWIFSDAYWITRRMLDNRYKTLVPTELWSYEGEE
tara:strand:+ start:476 stop:907 length:432 start_codon:yes stop_codon:yes gene_type:complete